MYHKGDKVMHPRHGVVVIEDLLDLEPWGERRTYLKLHPIHGDLTIMVPVDNTDQVGLRRVVSGDDIDKVWDLLREDGGYVPIIWSQRYKTNLAKLITGAISQVAEVVRDLSIRQRSKGLSTAEKRMLAKAREALISELTVASGSTEATTEVMLNEVLQGSS